MGVFAPMSLIPLIMLAEFISHHVCNIIHAWHALTSEITSAMTLYDIRNYIGHEMGNDIRNYMGRDLTEIWYNIWHVICHKIGLKMTFYIGNDIRESMSTVFCISNVQNHLDRVWIIKSNNRFRNKNSIDILCIIRENNLTTKLDNTTWQNLTQLADTSCWHILPTWRADIHLKVR